MQRISVACSWIEEEWLSGLCLLFDVGGEDVVAGRVTTRSLEGVVARGRLCWWKAPQVCFEWQMDVVGGST